MAVALRVEGRRSECEGNWPVWKVELWRRRWPERDLGSKMPEGLRVSLIVFLVVEFCGG